MGRLKGEKEDEGRKEEVESVKEGRRKIKIRAGNEDGRLVAMVDRNPMDKTKGRMLPCRERGSHVERERSLCIVLTLNVTQYEPECNQFLQLKYRYELPNLPPF